MQNVTDAVVGLQTLSIWIGCSTVARFMQLLGLCIGRHTASLSLFVKFVITMLVVYAWCPRLVSLQ